MIVSLSKASADQRQKHASQWQQDRACYKPNKVVAFAEDAAETLGVGASSC
jgi:hypothetical protein